MLKEITVQGKTAYLDSTKLIVYYVEDCGHGGYVVTTYLQTHAGIQEVRVGNFFETGDGVLECLAEFLYSRR